MGFVRALAACLAACLLAGAAAAQTYPNRTITMIVPFPPGGATDAIARIIQHPMEQALGQTIVIENIGGAGGMIAADKAARAEPDGYTFLIHQVALAAGMSMYQNLNFDAEKSFVTIGLINTAASALAGRPTLPADNFKELLTWMKEPGRNVKIGHPGVGSYGHLAGVLLAQELDIKATQIPYRGAGPALVDLLAGEVDLGIAIGHRRRPLGQVRQAEGFRHYRPRAVRRLARPANHGRTRLHQAQYRFLAYAPGARRDAAADRRQAQRRAARCAGRPQGAEDLRRRRHG